MIGCCLPYENSGCRAVCALVEAEHSQSAEIHVPVVFINFHKFDNERIGYTSYL